MVRTILYDQSMHTLFDVHEVKQEKYSGSHEFLTSLSIYIDM